MTAPSLTILIVPGTIRDGRSSIHPARYVTDRFREDDHDVELFDMKDCEIPLFRNRRDAVSDPHPGVDAFGEKVEAADALVIVAPEYNHSIPGTLKNLLDHLYPEYEDTAFSYVTVSAGGFGGVRALSHLYDITLEFNAHPGPDLPVSNVRNAFAEDGSLIDETYEDRFEKFVEAVVDHAEQFVPSAVGTPEAGV